MNNQDQQPTFKAEIQRLTDSNATFHLEMSALEYTVLLINLLVGIRHQENYEVTADLGTQIARQLIDHLRQASPALADIMNQGFNLALGEGERETILKPTDESIKATITLTISKVGSATTAKCAGCGKMGKGCYFVMLPDKSNGRIYCHQCLIIGWNYSWWGTRALENLQEAGEIL